MRFLIPARGWRPAASLLIAIACACGAGAALSQSDAFAPIDPLIPPPGATRSITGAPGPAYWQQRADYRIDAILDQPARTIRGTARIRYTNNSPETLPVLWLAAGETGDDPGMLASTAKPLTLDRAGKPQIREWEIGWSHARRSADRRFIVETVTDGKGVALTHELREGIMRVPLPQALRPGDSIDLIIRWSVALGDFHHIMARGGYEYFPETDSHLFAAGHWYPRILAFTDENGWATEAFLGEGEFAAEFGDFDVTIAVPADHVVAATGELANASDVLTPEQQRRLAAARQSDRPIFIITPQEAIANEGARKAGTRQWRFIARNVRDFAWASSPKFAWDAAAVIPTDKANPPVLAQSLYPYEAAGLWARQSTELIRHTLNVYGRHAFPYPYPVMTSVNAYSQPTGIEYPMMGFTGPRPVYDRASGTAQYGQATRDLFAELVIHESGHSWFPMIVGSDERRFGWMDEGINTLLNHIAMLEWRDTPGALFGGPLDQAFAQALQAPDRRPLMTLTDNTPGYFAAHYFKTAGALMMLRENVLGRATFDRALADYARRWSFRQPTPADFFRSIEDSAGRKLDWFWRGWFFGIDLYDMAIAGVSRFSGAPAAPATQASPTASQGEPPPEPLTLRGNREAGIGFAADRDPAQRDYYSVTAPDRGKGGRTPPPARQDSWMGVQVGDALRETPYIYGVVLANRGGLLLPQTLRLTLVDGTMRDQPVPVEMWRQNAQRIVVPVYAAQPVTGFALDPDRRTPDADRANDRFTGPVETAPIQPQRPAREDRGAMGTDGVVVTHEGEPIRQD